MRIRRLAQVPVPDNELAVLLDAAANSDADNRALERQRRSGEEIDARLSRLGFRPLQPSPFDLYLIELL